MKKVYIIMSATPEDVYYLKHLRQEPEFSICINHAYQFTSYAEAEFAILTYSFGNFMKIEKIYIPI